jgi:BlaI family penicillinase repressor
MMMKSPKLSKLEFQIMEALWGRGECSIRDIQESFPADARQAYTTIQTTLYRIETKGIVERVKKVGNFHVFAPAITREAAQRRLIDDLLALFGGRGQPVMAHLIETGYVISPNKKARRGNHDDIHPLELRLGRGSLQSSVAIDHRGAPRVADYARAQEESGANSLLGLVVCLDKIPRAVCVAGETRVVLGKTGCRKTGRIGAVHHGG